MWILICLERYLRLNSATFPKMKNQFSMQTFLRISLSIVLIALYSPSHAQDVAVSEQPTGTASINDWTDLIDEDLTHWEKWIGVPHSSVAGLPEGTYQSDDVHKGKPLGLNNDLKNVFTIQKDGEDLLLHVTGEIYGGLTTKESFQNFHLQMKHRWGDKKWPPRANTIRDSGVLYHCYGDHGSFWKVWKSCVEYQVQEKDYGDLFLLAGPKATSRASGGGKKKKFDPEADYAKRGNIAASSEPDLPNGQWNTIDIYVVGDAAIHVCNGVVVLAIKDITKKDGTRLDAGQIQLQSEAAECDYKEIRIRTINEFPAELAKAANM